MIVFFNFIANYTCIEATFAVRQCAKFSTNYKLLRNQAIKRVIKYLIGTATQGLILTPSSKKGIKFYVGTDFVGVCKKWEGTDPLSVLSKPGYVRQVLHIIGHNPDKSTQRNYFSVSLKSGTLH